MCPLLSVLTEADKQQPNEMEADEHSVRKDLIRHLRHLMIWESTLLLDLVEEVGMRGQGYVLIVPLSMKGRGRIVIFVDFPLVGRSADEVDTS